MREYDGVVRIGGRDVFVSVRGRDTGRAPLLLLMGIGGNADMWEPLRGMLAADRMTIALVVPGTGRSPTPALPLPLPAIARIVRRVLDHVGAGEVDVAGVSWGGLLAQQLARTARDRVRRLVLANTHFGIGSIPAAPGALRTLPSTDRYRDRGAMAEAARRRAPHDVRPGRRRAPGDHGLPRPLTAHAATRPRRRATSRHPT